jgi:class 3 adenylate cyclase
LKSSAALLASELLRKTIVNLDLRNYTDAARDLQAKVGPAAVSLLNRQIQELVDAALNFIGTEPRVLQETTGDGAILAFDLAADAHGFAVGVHRAAEQHNAAKRYDGQRWFRIGISTDMVHATDIVGTVRIDAIRLQTAAESGQILIDQTTFALLPAVLQMLYGPEETITVKNGERLAVHRYTVPKPPLPAAYDSVPLFAANYVERPKARAAVQELILNADGRSSGGAEGHGGIGKSVLAQALCRDPAVRQAFPDGVIWVTAGKEPAYDLVTRMGRWARRWAMNSAVTIRSWAAFISTARACAARRR